VLALSPEHAPWAKMKAETKAAFMQELLSPDMETDITRFKRQVKVRASARVNRDHGVPDQYYCDLGVLDQCLCDLGVLDQRHCDLGVLDQRHCDLGVLDQRHCDLGTPGQRHRDLGVLD